MMRRFGALGSSPNALFSGNSEGSVGRSDATPNPFRKLRRLLIIWRSLGMPVPGDSRLRPAGVEVRNKLATHRNDVALEPGDVTPDAGGVPVIGGYASLAERAILTLNQIIRGRDS